MEPAKPKPRKLNPKTQAELARIQSSIPKEWMGRVIIEREGFATVKKVLKKVLKDPEASGETRRKAKLALASGHLDVKVQETEPVAARLIDAYVAKEMVKSMIVGKLPKTKRRPDIKTALRIFNEAKAAYDKKYGKES